METLAENLSDGFVAPLLYLALGGLPLGMAYKAVNTLDSMVGYKNARYIRFGRAAAKLDDVANYIPARIAGLAIGVAAFFYFLPSGMKRASSAARESLAIIRRDGRKHTSPIPACRRQRWQARWAWTAAALPLRRRLRRKAPYR